MNTPNWQNRTLWTGDNLDIMRGMNSESVDLIYLDPPFNSKKDYSAPIGSKAAGAAFQDTWSLDDVKREWVEDIETDNTATWGAITAAGFTNGESAQAYLTYMAVRLIEMRRVLKLAGSIYLHCDPTMSHYLKVMMDAVFGHKNFVNEIQWRRYGAHNDVGQGSRHYGRVHDILLLYGNGDEPTWNQVFVPLDPQYVESTYRYVEEGTGRRFTTTPLTGPGGAAKGNPSYEWNGHTRYWRYSRETMEKLDREGRLYYSRTGYPRRKLYLDESRGVPVQDVWDDIRSLSGAHKERLDYPTQKPLKLLERLIQASSNEGDMVLDPFCGCATTCIAAEKLGRQWAGIDIEPAARDLVVQRLQQASDEGALLKESRLPEVHHLKNPPKRTDPDAPQRSKNIKQALYKRQEGRCAGNCGADGTGRELDLDLFEVDHIVPRAKGGADIDDNLQLLCSTCNRRKGSKTMAYLLGLIS